MFVLFQCCGFFFTSEFSANYLYMYISLNSIWNLHLTKTTLVGKIKFSVNTLHHYIHITHIYIILRVKYLFTTVCVSSLTPALMFLEASYPI